MFFSRNTSFASICKLEIMPWQPIIVYERRTRNATCIVSESGQNFQLFPITLFVIFLA